VRRELPPLLEARPQGQRALPRRLESCRNRWRARSSPSTTTRTSWKKTLAAPAAARTAIVSETHRREDRERVSREREKLRNGARAIPRKPSSATTRSICAPANTKTGRPGEIFIDMHKEGAAFRSLMNNFAISISIGLQYGRAAGGVRDAFTFTRFEPAGMVIGNDSIKNATSVLDYHLPRNWRSAISGANDLAHVVPSHDLDLGGGVGGRPAVRQGRSAGGEPHHLHRLWCAAISTASPWCAAGRRL